MESLTSLLWKTAPDWPDESLTSLLWKTTADWPDRKPTPLLAHTHVSKKNPTVLYVVFVLVQTVNNLINEINTQDSTEYAQNNESRY